VWTVSSLRFHAHTHTHTQWKRVWAFALFGIFVDTPFCQFWYSRLPRLTTAIVGPPSKTHALVRTSVSTILDTLIFSPVFYVLYFLFFGFVSGTYKTLQEAIEDIKVKLFPAWSAGTKVWPAANFITMFLLPQKLWMPANNLVAYAFNIYLSLLNTSSSSSKKKKVEQRMHCD
jgi:hypothetical protein